MAAPKTRPTGADVTAFLDAAEPPRRRSEGHALRALLERVTSQPATMWGPTLVGFGSSPLTNSLGTNDWFDLGFSPRKPAMTIYGIQRCGAAESASRRTGTAHHRCLVRLRQANG